MARPPPVWDISRTLLPEGLIRRTLMSCGKEWVVGEGDGGTGDLAAIAETGDLDGGRDRDWRHRIGNGDLIGTGSAGGGGNVNGKEIFSV